jgi:aerobic carbon-monoxide dehydrogenase large subunit
MTKYFGAPVERVEDEALITGHGRYTGDISLPGLLAAHFLRSVHAHARIKSIDVSKARKMPGVHAVYTFGDLPQVLREKPFPLLVNSPVIKQGRTWHALVESEACYVGEPLAVIVADNRYIAEDAAELIVVDYDPLPTASDCRKAVLDGASLAHADAPDNVAAVFTISTGDADGAIKTAPHVHHESLWQHRGCGHAMEGRAVTAVYDPNDDLLTSWSATQAPYLVKSVIGLMLGLDDTKIRVVAPDVGGGFGPKGIVYQEDVVVPWLARKLGRPIGWVEDRYEQSVSTTQERDEYAEADVAYDDQGKLIAIRVGVIHDTGAYLPWGVITPMIGATTLPGPYVLPNYKMVVHVALTNKIATSPLRGTGRPQAVFTIERLLDRIAQALDLDPVVVRERNMIRPEQLPYKVGIVGRDGSPVTYDSGDYPKCQRMALDKIDYAGFSTRQRAALEKGRYIGIGIANLVEATGLGPYEGASVRVLTSGKIGVFTSAASQGQSHKTVFSQIAADCFGTGLQEIEVTTADTSKFPIGVGTFASRVAVNTGSSVHEAATKLRGRVLKLAAKELGVGEQDLDIVPRKVVLKDGVKPTRNRPREIALTRLLTLSAGMPGFTSEDKGEPGLTETAFFSPAQSTYSNATHVVEVEVDPEIGNVEILRYVVGHDCGKVINPMVVDGQIQGGVAHGIGNAFYEFMDYDENGQPQTHTLEEYLLPGILDVPEVEIVQMESPSPLNPIGVKGAGEAGTIPAAAAIIAAVENALGPFGVRIAQQPISAQQVLGFIADAKKAGGPGRAPVVIEPMEM